MKNCASCKIEHHHSLSFLSVSGSTTISHIQGLDFEHQQNGLHRIHVTLLCGDGQRQNLLIKTENT
jgi:hypothetical protein